MPSFHSLPYDVLTEKAEAAYDQDTGHGGWEGGQHLKGFPNLREGL